MDERTAGAHSRNAVLVDLGVVVVVFAAAGLVAGLVWPHLVTPVTVIRVESGTFRDEVEQAHRIGYDGWYAALGAAGGFLAGVVCVAMRRAHEVVTVLAVTGGGMLAAAVSAGVGGWAGPQDPAVALSDAEVLTAAPDVVRVYAEGVYLVWSIAALCGAVVVLWSGVGAPRRRVSPEDSQPPPKQP